MAVTAQVVFTQTGNSRSPGGAGQALVAIQPAGPTDNTPANIVVENNDNVDVVNWAFYLLDVPIGSELTPNLDAPVQSGNDPTYQIPEIPNLPGTYRIQITVTDAEGNSSTDAHDVVVPTYNHGWLIPGFLSDDATFNYGDDSNSPPGTGTVNYRGWYEAWAIMVLFLDAFSAAPAAISQIRLTNANSPPSSPKTLLPQQRAIVDTSAGPVTVKIPVLAYTAAVGAVPGSSQWCEVQQDASTAFTNAITIERADAGNIMQLPPNATAAAATLVIAGGTYVGTVVRISNGGSGSGSYLVE